MFLLLRLVLFSKGIYGGYSIRCITLTLDCVYDVFVSPIFSFRKKER